MSKTKFLASVLLALAVLFAQAGSAMAAPQAQDVTPITGTIQSITTETNYGVTTVVVTLLEGQTVRLSLDNAISLGLVTLDPATQLPVVDPTKVGTPVSIDPATVAPEPVEEGDVHPISWLIGQFFDVDPGLVDQYHGEDGFGFGVIAHAMWIAKDLNGGTADAALAGEILVAKQDKDFETFFANHPEYAEVLDGETPTNWGQFKKALKALNENNDKHNLGVIVSDKEGAEDAAPGENGKGPKKPKKENHGNPNKP